jgi:hypothetical protein
MMSFIGKGGSFKRWLSGSSGTGCAIGVGGTWKSITGMWIGEGGAWKRFFPVEKVTLSGTSGSPNVIAKPAGGLVTITWEFTTSGGVLGDGAPFNSGTEWIDVAPQLEYWIRAQTNSGSPPSSGTVNSWLKLAGSGSATRSWTWSANNVTLAGSIQVDIATDSAGTNIVATGYYGAQIGV